MPSGNRGVVLTFLIIFSICIAALVGVVYSFLQVFDVIKIGGNVEALEPDRPITIVSTKYDFNFAVPKEQLETNSSQQTTYQIEPDIQTEESITTKEASADETVQIDQNDQFEQDSSTISDTVTKPTYNYNFPIPKKVEQPAIKTLAIPTINYNSPVIYGGEADTGIDHGAWAYPSNHPREGEAIFLCHRRYFKAHDPRSCWNLDKVNPGNYVYINYTDNTQDSYVIESISVTPGTDLNIFNYSDDSYIKLISCAKEDGHIGSDSHRIILIAKKVS